ncbi:MAG TPA: decaprenyl-phosphate phosphoribosyltransferase [Burkholderiales bacterium]|nr:decaprenyl-phosphate phosphoribosyltransferase [Burkholderiales bacterium]
MLLRSALRLIRPHQWIKNGFVLVGMVFGHGWTNRLLIADALTLFAAFCLVSSAVYVMNDLADREADRLHPTKRSRPLARGDIGAGAALALCVVLALAGLGLAALVSLTALSIAAAYVVLNVAYSAGLKHVAILDVFIISAGFMLRILAGTLGIGIAPSRWLLLCGLMLTLFLGFCKRRAELIEAAGAEGSGASTGQRAALDGYSAPLVDLLIAVSVADAAIGYALYTVDQETILLHGTDRLMYTLPFVLYGLFRYLQLVYSKGGGADPAWELLHDPHLIAAAAGWLGATWWLIAAG